jgi:predicted amidohydrolase
VRLSLVQAEVDLGDRPRNLARAVAALDAEAAAGCDLAVFPELSLTGYVFESRAEAEAHAESIPGPSTDAIAAAARRTGVAAAVGLLERDAAGRVYNAVAFVGPAGVLGVYRKTHLPAMGVDRFLDRGDRLLPPLEIADVRVSALVCYDGTFPEPTRALALRGAELVVLPTNWPEQESLKGDFLPATRALENVVWFAAVNRVRTERGVRFLGNSSLADPGGRTVVRLGAEAGVARAVVDPATARVKRRVTAPGLEVDRFRDRRPSLYGDLVDPRFLGGDERR